MAKIKNEKVFTDPEQYPEDEMIFNILGGNKKLWISFFNYIKVNHPDFISEWKYYNDGKSWLMKTGKKSTTIFWLSVIENTFRATFYLAPGYANRIMESSIQEELKEQYKSQIGVKKIPGITIKFAKAADVESAKELIEIKLSKK